MRRCEVVEKVTSMLDDNGPMTVKELSKALNIVPIMVQGAIKHMSANGNVYVYRKNRQKGNTWALR